MTLTHEQDVRKYLERIERAEREQARRWWKRMEPIDTCDMGRAIAERWQNVERENGAIDAKRLLTQMRAYHRVRRNIPHCIPTFNLICKNGIKRKESICQLANIMRRKTSTSATGRK